MGRVSSIKALVTLGILCLLTLEVLPAPIHDAAQRGDVQKLKEELSKGVDINAKDASSMTPLIWAIYSRKREIVEYLVSKGADVNAGDFNGNTPLFWAAMTQNIQESVVQYLLDHGADPNIRNRIGQSPLFSASTKEIAQIFVKNGLDPDLIAEGGVTPISNAVSKLPEVVKFLIDAGANVNGKGSQVPIIMAAGMGRYENLCILLDHGANVTAKDDLGRCALHYAHDPKIAELLISKRLDVNSVDKSGNTPLHEIVNPNVATILISAGADPTIKNQYGKTPLENLKWRYEAAKKQNNRREMEKFEQLFHILNSSSAEVSKTSE